METPVSGLFVAGSVTGVENTAHPPTKTRQVVRFSNAMHRSKRFDFVKKSVIISF